MQIAIIDDEQHARALIRRTLEEHYDQEVSIILEADSVQQGKALLENEALDLLFLDIQLKDGTGFDLLDQFADLDCTLVFVTAFNHFALRAFDFFAFGYLVKPYQKSDLIRVIDRYLNDRSAGNPKFTKELMEAYNARKLHKIAINELEGFRLLDIDTILYLRSDNNYTEFFTADGSQFWCSKTLKIYEKLLLPEGFFRVHRSFLVNLNFVEGYSNKDGGSVIMKNQKQLPISRRKLAAFRQIFLS